MKNNTTRKLCIAAVIAALYAVLTLVLPMLSYGPVQIRFSEALTVLPFFFPEAIPGLAVGCFIANLIGSPYVLDMVFGTLATLLAAVWTSVVKKDWLAPLPPVICNMIIVGAEIAWSETGFGSGFLTAAAVNGASVAVGELIACYVLGMLLVKFIPGIKFLRPYIREDRLPAVKEEK